MTEVHYFDSDNKPMMLETGQSTELRKFDAFDNETEVAYFDTLDRPVEHKNGFQKIVWKYDEAGNPMELHVYRVDGSEIDLASRRAH